MNLDLNTIGDSPAEENLVKILNALDEPKITRKVIKWIRKHRDGCKTIQDKNSLMLDIWTSHFLKKDVFLIRVKNPNYIRDNYALAFTVMTHMQTVITTNHRRAKNGEFSQ